MSKKLVSICIPSYNRPAELRRLLESIDSKRIQDIEVVICEDKAPRRLEVRKQVDEFKAHTQYEVNYIENEQNCGYYKNLRNLINNATGEFIVFMGDDDLFVEGAFDQYLQFIENHRHCGYILRSYRNNYKDGSIEVFRYFSTDKEFEASKDTYINLFGKSVFVSGFTIRRDCAKEFESDLFDGSLLYQMYLLAETCYKYPSAYSRIIITQAIEGGVPYFGSSEAEKDIYTPGTITVDNSINFMAWYNKLVDYIAKEHNDDSNIIIKKNMSKYSYPVLAIQREKGIKEFTKYAKRLKALGQGDSIYFYVYFIGLVVFGKKICNSIIRFLKRVIGHRPSL